METTASLFLAISSNKKAALKVLMMALCIVAGPKALCNYSLFKKNEALNLKDFLKSNFCLWFHPDLLKPT